MSGAPAEQAAEPILRVEGLGKRFGERSALGGVSFELGAGELVAVVGPNGAGKTTLLSILAGVQSASTGTVSGRATHDGTREIGWAPQQAAVYGRLTVRENLRLFARLERVSDADAAVARMLEQTGLAPRAADRVEDLSGGNRQRVNVALGAARRPAGARARRAHVGARPGAARASVGVRLRRSPRAGTGVLFSTHHLGEVARYATRAIVLAEGEMLFDGAPGELLGAVDGEDDAEGVFLKFLAGRA